MSSYRDLKIYKKAFDLAIRAHRATQKFPKYETYELGSQLRKSSMSVKDNIVEGYGRRKYKPEFLKFLTYSHSSCDEATSQITSITILYPDIEEFNGLLIEYESLGRQISTFIKYVEKNWNNL